MKTTVVSVAKIKILIKMANIGNYLIFACVISMSFVIA